MPKIIRLETVESIKPGSPPTVAPDGTIINPVPYSAVDVEFDDGIKVQVERPLTAAKVKAAYDNAEDALKATIDGVTAGDVV